MYPVVRGWAQRARKRQVACVDLTCTNQRHIRTGPRWPVRSIDWFLGVPWNFEETHTLPTRFHARADVCFLSEVWSCFPTFMSKLFALLWKHFIQRAWKSERKVSEASNHVSKPVVNHELVMWLQDFLYISPNFTNFANFYILFSTLTFELFWLFFSNSNSWTFSIF